MPGCIDESKGLYKNFWWILTHALVGVVVKIPHYNEEVKWSNPDPSIFKCI